MSEENEILIYKEKVLKLLETEGNLEQIKSIIREKLNQSNWREEVRQLTLKQLNPENIEETTSEMIMEKIYDKVLLSLPKNLFPTIENNLKDILNKKQVQIEQERK